MLQTSERYVKKQAVTTQLPLVTQTSKDRPFNTVIAVVCAGKKEGERPQV